MTLGKTAKAPHPKVDFARSISCQEILEVTLRKTKKPEPRSSAASETESDMSEVPEGKSLVSFWQQREVVSTSESPPPLWKQSIDSKSKTVVNSKSAMEFGSALPTDAKTSLISALQNVSAPKLPTKEPKETQDITRKLELSSKASARSMENLAVKDNTLGVFGTVKSRWEMSFESLLDSSRDSVFEKSLSRSESYGCVLDSPHLIPSDIQSANGSAFSRISSI